MCCVDVVRSCRLLQKLTLDFWGFDDDYGVHLITPLNVHAVLMSLVHLELREVREENVAYIRQFLGHFDIPNLDSLTIHPYPSNAIIPGADLYGSLVRSRFSHIFNGSRLLTPLTGG
jgi:hypothetical protein